MAGWLRQVHDGDDDEPLVDPDEVEAMLPPSVRGPEGNRFTPLGSDLPEGAPDPDLAFFSTIAEEVDRGKSSPTVTGPLDVNPRVAGVDRDEMRAFRELMADRDRERWTKPRLAVEQVDMADLLDELATTAAALRQRRRAA